MVSYDGLAIRNSKKGGHAVALCVFAWVSFHVGLESLSAWDFFFRVSSKFRFLDFFAGAGLVTEAVSPYFDVVWANDISAKKAEVYLANHGSHHFRLGSVEAVSGDEIPAADLAWASFPCQDLSLAGNQAGIQGNRSGMVWEWLRVIEEMPARSIYQPSSFA